MTLGDAAQGRCEVLFGREYVGGSFIELLGMEVKIEIYRASVEDKRPQVGERLCRGDTWGSID